MDLSIKNLVIPSNLNTSENDIREDFFTPLLSNSMKYDRGVGYFTSGWLSVNAKGMLAFAGNGGKARWVVSPILDEKDWKALKKGSEAKQNLLLRIALRDEIDNLKAALEKDVLSALSWMVADGIVDFRLAVLKGELSGEFHDKFGVFHDSFGNAVSFNGSNNETAKGFFNYESFKVFVSWNDALKDFVMSDQARFDRIWNNQDDNVRVIKIGDAAKEQIVKLRPEERPYRKPEWILEEPSLSIYDLFSKPSIPIDKQLWDHQIEAIEAWAENNYQGFLEMATGSGKTITSLAGMVRLFEQKKKLAIIISVPYQHLVEQWYTETKKFQLRPVKAFKSRQQWLNELTEQIREYNQGYREVISIISTHTTFAKDHFQELIAKIKGPALLIADEAHHLGSKSARLAYPWNIPYRLALSATPDRWFDDIGTAALRDYFGPTVFQFTLKEAIGVSLTEYFFHPVLVELTEDELEEYKTITTKIAQIYSKARTDPATNDRLSVLLRDRANLLNKAENKLAILSSLVDKNPVDQHNLFYCAPGQIDDVVRLLGRDKGILLHKFTNEEDNDLRKSLLSQFDLGDLEALVAIKCLDEGVDVPRTKTAYLLASSSNPREFIQRRGRILRRAPGKKIATLFDLIAVPPTAWTTEREDPNFKIERNLIRKELGRFKEFADTAKNKHQAINAIWEIAKRYHLTDF
ncbi:MAG: DEAD/DEAH box helicase family protein [Bacteroidota bacterium]